jgi:hypothetical protein
MRPWLTVLSAGVAVLFISGCTGPSAPSRSSLSASAGSPTVRTATSSSDSPFPRHGSSITVETGTDVKVLIADLRGDSSDVGARAILARDPKTTCLTDGKQPIALPVGTKLEGAGGDVTIVAPDGTRYHLGDRIEGGSGGSTRAEIEADYGTLPEDCGPPPWLVIHDELGPARSP